MTVRELVEALQKLPQDKEVRLLTECGCYCEEIASVFLEREDRSYGYTDDRMGSGIVIISTDEWEERYLTGPEFLASLDRCCDKHTPEEALAAIKDIEEG